MRLYTDCKHPGLLTFCRRSPSSSEPPQNLLSQSVQHQTDVFTWTRFQFGGREVHFNTPTDTSRSQINPLYSQISDSQWAAWGQNQKHFIFHSTVLFTNHLPSYRAPERLMEDKCETDFWTCEGDFILSYTKKNLNYVSEKWKSSVNC